MSKGRSDGIERAGSTNGRPRWKARIVARHPDTGEKIVDTVRYVVADNKAAALTAKEALRDELVARKLGRVGKVERMRFGDAVDRYMATLTRYGTIRTYRVYAKTIKALWGDRWLDSLEVDEVQRKLSAMAKRYSATHIGGHRGIVVNIFGWAVEQGVIKGPHRFREVRVRYRKSADDIARELETPTKKGLTREEIPCFLAEVERIDPQVHKLVLAQLVLGSRFSDTSAIKRSDVNWETGEVRIVRGHVSGRLGPPKNNKARNAAFPHAALAIIRGHVAEMDRLKWPGHEEWLFPRRPDPRQRVPAPMWNIWHVINVVRRAQAACGIDVKGATHSLRHTLIGIMRGEASDAVMRAVVGHSSESTTQRYGDAKVIQFATDVQRVVMDGPPGEPGTPRKRG